MFFIEKERVGQWVGLGEIARREWMGQVCLLDRQGEEMGVALTMRARLVANINYSVNWYGTILEMCSVSTNGERASPAIA